MGLLGQPVEETDNFTHLFHAFGVGLCDESIQLTGLDSDLEDIVSLGVAATNQTELISQGLLIEEWQFGEAVKQTDYFTHLFYAFGVGLCEQYLEDIVSLGVAATNQTELISQGLLIEEWHFGEAVKQTDYFTHLFHAFGVGLCEQSINQTGFDRDL